MPLLAQVIDEFKSGFQYLNGAGHRQPEWYEFWQKYDFTKKRFTDEKLTEAIEIAVQDCNGKLEKLKSEHGDQDFDSHKEEFFTIVADVIHRVQVKRFAHGEISTRNFEHANQYIFERLLIPKGPGTFESKLIAGLNAVKAKFPELTTHMDSATKKVNRSRQGYTVFFHESATKNSAGETIYSSSESGDMNSIASRESYASSNISKLKF
ncbi:hypothetical protein [Legionella brunensis]|uniref:Uncharacterized protein n=1 Tax=Legionella brunensis TaxID=29422 RepID=A0A0W0SD51_9GAMM|nr:hypothetical protein [Legionella brunensis]KTC81350.1 hypothetical protein Lbru_1870 [Legionella brunensis]